MLIATATSSVWGYAAGAALAIIGTRLRSRGRLNYWFPGYVALTGLGIIGGAYFAIRGELFLGLFLLGMGALFGLATWAMWKEDEYQHRER